MRIGFDAKRLFFNNRGLGNYSRSTVSLLAEYAPDNEYILFSPKSRIETNTPHLDQLPVVYPSGRGINKIPAIWRSYAMSRAIDESELDIYHGLCHEIPADIARSKARSVVTMHDLIFERYPQLYKRADRFMFRRKYSRSCRLADRVVAISEQTRQDLIELWSVPAHKIDVVYQAFMPNFVARVS